MKKIIVICALFLTWNTTAYCGQLSKIELTDGSIINGEIVSYLNGIYTINTTNFGEMKISSAKISKVESANNTLSKTSTSPTVQSNDLNQSQVNTYGQTLMKNPENSAIFKGLTNDPTLQEMAKDPQIQNAANTGDIQALINNPKFMEIVNSPEMQEAVKKLKK